MATTLLVIHTNNSYFYVEQVVTLCYTRLGHSRKLWSVLFCCWTHSQTVVSANTFWSGKWHKSCIIPIRVKGTLPLCFVARKYCKAPHLSDFRSLLPHSLSSSYSVLCVIFLLFSSATETDFFRYCSIITLVLNFISAFWKLVYVVMLSSIFHSVTLVQSGQKNSAACLFAFRLTDYKPQLCILGLRLLSSWCIELYNLEAGS